jgi:hypothetical protein
MTAWPPTIHRMTGLFEVVAETALRVSQPTSSCFIQAQQFMNPCETQANQQDVAQDLFLDLVGHVFNVRYAPESGSRKTPVALPICAISGNSAI